MADRIVCRSSHSRLPTPVLRINGRKAELTEAGKVLLRRSRSLVEESLALERLADVYHRRGIFP